MIRIRNNPDKVYLNKLMQGLKITRVVIIILIPVFISISAMCMFLLNEPYIATVFLALFSIFSLIGPFAIISLKTTIESIALEIQCPYRERRKAELEEEERWNRSWGL